MTYLETKVFRLSTLSPIHIQAGEPGVYGQGFIRLHNSDDFLYVVDIPKLQAEIFAFKGLEAVETYTKAYSNPGSKTNIATVLNNIGYNYKANIDKISKGIVRLPSGHRFIRTGLGKHFVPGSSIKGAIKTAVLYENVQQRIAAGSLDLNEFVKEQINWYKKKQGSYNKRKFRESFAKRLLQNAFESIHPWERTQNRKRKNENKGPFKDFFRAIKVKDALIKKPNGVRFKDILFTTLEGNKVVEKDAGDNTLYECFYGETAIEISIDKEIFNSFKRAGADPPFNNLKDLLQICHNFAQAQWKDEQKYLRTYGSGSINLDEIKAFYNVTDYDQRASLRVGWGTGMLGTTISRLLDETIRVKLRNEVISFDGEYRPKPAPKSRRFVLENKLPVHPLGWIEIKE